MTGIVKARHTLTSELLHLLENRESRGEATWVKTLVELTEKSETTIRKAVNELLEGGFIERVPLATTQLRTVRKQDLIDAPEEVKNMADTTTKTVTTGRGRPNDPAVQERDGKVLAFIGKSKEGATVAEIAEAVGIECNAAYLSVWRLRVAGSIVKTPSGSRAPRWAKAA